MIYRDFYRKEISERLSPFVLLLCALWLALFDVFEATPGYKAATFLPEWLWALIFSAIAIFHLSGMRLNHRRMRRVALFFTSLIWFLWTYLIASLNARSFGPVIYFSIAAGAFWTFARIKK